MNLPEFFTRMNAAQLLMASLSIVAAVFFVIFLICKGFSLLFKSKKPDSFQKERNRFKAEIAREQGDRELADAVKSVLLVIAVFIVLIAFTHGK